MEDKILHIASEKHGHEVTRSENFDSKATNLITVLGVIVTLMSSLFTYTLITWGSSHAAEPLAMFYPILIAGLALLIISIGLSLMIINPVGKKVTTKINLQDLHNRYKNDTDGEQIRDELVSYYHNFTTEMHDINEQKALFFKYSTILALAGLTLFSIDAGMLIGQFVFNIKPS